MDNYVVVLCLSCKRKRGLPTHYRAMTVRWFNDLPEGDQCGDLEVLALLVGVEWKDVQAKFTEVMDRHRAARGSS